MMTKVKWALVGASGHARVVIDILRLNPCNEVSFLVDDDHQKVGHSLDRVYIAGGINYLIGHRAEVDKVIVCIGNCQLRFEVVSQLQTTDIEFGTAIHPTATLSATSTIGAGSVMMAGAVVNAGARVGQHSIINTRSSVDHDCNIGNCSHIAPGATLCGGVHVGQRTFVGAGATVISNCRIGDHVVVGAGATVLSDLQGDMSYVGTPAKALKT